MTMANTVVYYDTAKNIAVKICIVQAPGAERHFTRVDSGLTREPETETRL
jgi:hypothetical protein